MIQGYIFEEALDGDKALIAGLGTVSPTTVGVLEIVEEGQDGFDVQIKQSGRSG